MRKSGIILALLLACLYFWFARTHKASEEISTPVVEHPTSSPRAPVTSPVVTSAPLLPKILTRTQTKTHSKAEEKEVNMDSMKIIYAPDSDIRNEVAQNPEQTPKSLIAFSVNLGKQMDAALRSHSEAEKLSQNLVACATGTGESKNHSVQAICLNDARTLGKKYPELMDDYKKAVSLADPSVATMASFLSK